MASISLARVKRELKELKEKRDSGVEITVLDEGNLTHLQGKIDGPDGTPYKSGKFVIDIVIPETYPFSPPKCKFITRIWHPNVSSQTGAICLDILKDQWAAAMSLRTVLLSIQALLAAAEPRDPQDAVVAKQYMEDHPAYVAKAREWTAQYASGLDPAELPENREKLGQLTAMGFDAARARDALIKHNWNLEEAVNTVMMM
eukprot:m.235494 g.235494  ORF g.235494 m.235494 type:complete len:201 (-) comp12834_c0_seq1:83-685(-)